MADYKKIAAYLRANTAYAPKVGLEALLLRSYAAFRFSGGAEKRKIPLLMLNFKLLFFFLLSPLWWFPVGNLRRFQGVQHTV